MSRKFSTLFSVVVVVVGLRFATCLEIQVRFPLSTFAPSPAIASVALAPSACCQIMNLNVFIYNLILMAFPLFMSATFLPMLSLSAFIPFRQTFNLFSCRLARLRLRQSQFHESHVNKPCERNFARPSKCQQCTRLRDTLYTLA